MANCEEEECGRDYLGFAHLILIEQLYHRVKHSFAGMLSFFSDKPLDVDNEPVGCFGSLN
ncbi:unannotated protein [freshwater metagenome]|uniref:Unannotated protein n=1 Tax=freshwater metagenome TaxID=449393 RepID=A0A6J7GP67_9ZZZZ